MDKHWLTRRETVRKLWIIFAVVLALTVLAEAFFPTKPHFSVEAIFGFSAWYGFLACAVLIAVAKLLGLWLKRPDTYYDEADRG